MYDIVIVGARVCGCSIARELSKKQANILVVEKEEDVCCGTSKANSALIHAVYDATHGTLMAKLNVEGSRLMPQLAKDLDVNVMFLGYRKDIPQIIACSDIGVIPSNREGLGLAGIEMLSGGIPVVGSSVLGIKDYVIPEITGYLADPFDPEGFADGISKLLDKSAREKMKDDCFNKAKSFDREISGHQLMDIYKEIDKMIGA